MNMRWPSVGIAFLAMFLWTAPHANAVTEDYGEQCSYVELNDNNLLQVCAWLRIDRTNHKIRAYGSAANSSIYARQKASQTNLLIGGTAYYIGSTHYATSNTTLVSSTGVTDCTGSEYKSTSNGATLNSSGTNYSGFAASYAARTFCT